MTKRELEILVFAKFKIGWRFPTTYYNVATTWYNVVQRGYKVSKMWTECEQDACITLQFFFSYVIIHHDTLLHAIRVAALRDTTWHNEFDLWYYLS